MKGILLVELEWQEYIDKNYVSINTQTSHDVTSISTTTEPKEKTVFL